LSGRVGEEEKGKRREGRGEREEGCLRFPSWEGPGVG